MLFKVVGLNYYHFLCSCDYLIYSFHTTIHLEVLPSVCMVELLFMWLYIASIGLIMTMSREYKIDIVSIVGLHSRTKVCSSCSISTVIDIIFVYTILFIA